jgi:hypothetical protein
VVSNNVLLARSKVLFLLSREIDPVRASFAQELKDGTLKKMSSASLLQPMTGEYYQTEAESYLSQFVQAATFELSKKIKIFARTYTKSAALEPFVENLNLFMEDVRSSLQLLNMTLGIYFPDPDFDKKVNTDRLKVSGLGPKKNSLMGIKDSDNYGTLLKNIDRLFSEKISYYGVIEPLKGSILSMIVKVLVKVIRCQVTQSFIRIFWKSFGRFLFPMNKRSTPPVPWTI